MAGDPRVLGLLEEILDAGRTPEEVCRDCPELLAEVRRRWFEFRFVDDQVGELLPGLRTPPGLGGVAPAPPAAVPQVPGYKLLDEVGRGGMGVVYRARDTALVRDVAVKLLRDRYPADSPIARRFTDEARITAQLQHPGIPPVHAVGVLSDGSPFLAMKLIKGQTLAARLARRPGEQADGFASLRREPGEARAAGSTPPADAGGSLGRGSLNFIAVFEQVCQAVAYAHDRRVIHRDLKPSNVMVGKFGEVQVMDWGLAKVLPEGGPPAVAGRERRPAEGGTVIRTPRAGTADTPEAFGGSTPATRAGSVLGTPAYMSTEQAGGEVDRLDERCDVFGLGAILCEILTGKPPYTGRDEDQVFRQAMSANQADAHARLAACRAEPELVALCLRCLAAEPDDRPRDAGEVAEAVAALRAAAEDRARRAELDRLRAAEQAKRRRMLLAASGAVAAVLLAGLGASLWQTRRATTAEATAITSAEQARLNAENAERSAREAVAERDAKGLALAAEQRARQDEAKARQQAFDALRTMTAEVVARKFAQGAALTDDDRKFLRGVIAQFDAFAAIKGDDPDSRAVRAEGRMRVGWMRHRLGEIKEAEQDYDQAVEIQGQLASDFPARPEFQETLAKTLTARGILLYTTGRPKEAERDYDRALGIQKKLAAEFPARPEFREQVATTHNNRGSVRADTGRFPEAVNDFDEALGIRERLAADFPARPEYRDELAASHANRARVRYTTNRMPEAAKDFDRAVDIYSQLRADFPSRPEFRQNLARSHLGRAALLRHLGRLKESEQDYDWAVGGLKQLSADFPARPAFRQDLAMCHNNRGKLLYQSGRAQEAERAYDLALGLRRQLAADFPDQPDRRNELADTYLNLALLYKQRGDWAAAKRLLLEGGPHHRAALTANPRHPGYRQSYNTHLGALTATHAGLLEREDAIRTAETCRDVGRDAAADAYDAARFLSLCVSIVAKHDKLDATQREEEARLYSDAAMKLLREAVGRGYKNVAHLASDADFAPLRQREDFRKLMAELDGIGK
jgi:serine/threonine protein kinase